MSKKNPLVSALLEPVLDMVQDSVDLQDKYAEQRRSVFRASMPIQTMQTYLAGFFGDDFYDDMILARNKNHPPTITKFKSAFLSACVLISEYHEPMSDEIILAEGNVRPLNIYPLTADEVDAANKKIDEIPLLSKTIAAFQAGLTRYFDDLKLLCLSNPVAEIEKQDVLIEALDDMARNAREFSFMHDLLPVLALEVGDKSFSGDMLRNGLTQAFRKSVFKSFSGELNDPEIRRCPFSKVVGHLINTVIETDHQGRLSCGERTEPGALLMFVSERIMEMESARTLSNTPSNPSMPT